MYVYDMPYAMHHTYRNIHHIIPYVMDHDLYIIDHNMHQPPCHVSYYIYHV